MTLTHDDLDAAVARIKYFDAQPHPAEQAWYGLDRPLKQWADLPASIPILLSTHHGVEVMVEEMPSHIRSRNPIIVSRADFQAFYQEKHGKQAFRAGNPYVLHRRLNGIERAPDARGTLAFPAHSTHHITVEFDVQRYIDRLLGLPEAFHPISVCLYWKDLLLGRAQPFLERGIPVFTSGHIFDPDFHRNFYDIIKNFAYAATNSFLSSAPVLCLEMGIPVFFLDDRLTFTENGQDVNRRLGDHDEFDLLHTFDDPVAREYLGLLPRYRPGMGPADIAPPARLLELVALMHACDELTDPTLIRTLIFQTYVLYHPQGKACLKVVAENLPLLQNGRYEQAFAGLPDMLDFCRTICRYPSLVFQQR